MPHLQTQAGNGVRTAQRDDRAARRIGRRGGRRTDLGAAIQDDGAFADAEVLAGRKRKCLRGADGERAGAVLVHGVESSGRTRGGQRTRQVDITDGVKAQLTIRRGVDTAGEVQGRGGSRPDRRIVIERNPSGVGVDASNVGQLAAEIDASVEDIAGALQREVIRDGDPAREFEGGAYGRSDRRHGDDSSARRAVGAQAHDAIIEGNSTRPAGVIIGSERKPAGAVLDQGVGQRREAEGTVQG